MTSPAGTAWIDPSNRIWVDNTTLKQFSTCSLAAMIRYGWGYQPVGEISAPLKSGSAGHEAMAVYLTTWDKSLALAKLQELYKDWASENVKDGDRLSYENVYTILDAWFDAHPPSALPYHIRPDLVEIPFAVAIADDVVFFGRMDFIGQSADDRVWCIIDTKLTGRMDAKFLAKFRADTQMSGYIYAARQVTDRNVMGAMINAIELSKLPETQGGIEICPTHDVVRTTCASEHTTKCRKHKMMMTACAHLHLTECKTHKVSPDICRGQHAKWQFITTSRKPDQLEEWRKTAVMKARQMREMMLKYPTIESAPRLRKHGEFVDVGGVNACVFCDVADWCQSGRQHRLVPTMLKHEPWHPWNYWESEVR